METTKKQELAPQLKLPNKLKGKQLSRQAL